MLAHTLQTESLEAETEAAQTDSPPPPPLLPPEPTVETAAAEEAPADRLAAEDRAETEAAPMAEAEEALACSPRVRKILQNQIATFDSHGRS